MVRNKFIRPAHSVSLALLPQIIGIVMVKLPLGNTVVINEYLNFPFIVKQKQLISTIVSF